MRVFSALGIGPRTQVIAYDESTGAMAAARLWWLLKWAGHDAAAVLDGGFKAWTAAGMPCASRARVQGPVQVRCRIQARARGGCRARALGAERSRLGRPGCEDRRALQGRERDARPGGGAYPRRGLGAVWRGPRLGWAFQAGREIARLYESAMGGRDAEHTIVYCGSGVTAAHGVLACAHAGLGRAPVVRRLLERLDHRQGKADGAVGGRPPPGTRIMFAAFRR